MLVHHAFMLGFPSETEEKIQSTIDRAARSSFHTAAFFRMPPPFKGTEFFTQVEHAGFDLPTDWSAYEPHQTETNLSTAPGTTITKLRKDAYRRFYFNPKRL